MNEKLHELLANLRLKGWRPSSIARSHGRRKEGTPVSEVIYRLLLEEQAYRRTRASSIVSRSEDTLGLDAQTFPSRDSRGDRSQINELAGLAFIERKEKRHPYRRDRNG